MLFNNNNLLFVLILASKKSYKIEKIKSKNRVLHVAAWNNHKG